MIAAILNNGRKVVRYNLPQELSYLAPGTYYHTKISPEITDEIPTKAVLFVSQSYFSEMTGKMANDIYFITDDDGIFPNNISKINVRFPLSDTEIEALSRSLDDRY